MTADQASAEPKGDEPEAKLETKAERKARERAEREAAKADQASAEPKGDEPGHAPKRRVWAHGSLCLDGKTYAAGEIVDLPEHVAATLSCLELVGVKSEE